MLTKLITTLIIVSSLMFGTQLSTVNIVVTGKPASQQLIMAAIDNYLQTNYNFKYNGAFLEQKEYLIEPLAIGQWHTLAIPITIEKNGETEQLPVTFNIFNQPLKFEQVDQLVMSNEPEVIKRTGRIMNFVMENKKSTRFFYYHKNDTDKELILSVVAENPSWQDCSLHLLYGSGGPSKDGLYAGHVALNKYFKALNQQEGFIFKIAGRREKTLFYQKLAPGEIATGIIELRLLNDTPIKVKLFAENYESFGIVEHLYVNSEENKQRISGVFAAPYQYISQTIDLDEQIKTYRIGDEPFIVDYLTKRKLRGNYGLLYKYQLRLINNSDKIKELKFYFLANGGVARGNFLINNSLLETNLVGTNRGDNIEKFYQLEIEPRSEKTVEIKTMPQAGSNYPVTLMLRSTDR